MLSLFLSFAFAAPFTGSSIAEVENYIAQERITTLEEFLPRLSEDHRANFVLMRQSMSLQPTKDPLSPRAILFGRDAKIVFAFNHTSPSIEMMENRGDRFEFARLNFGPNGQITKQTNCQGCHNGHPLWGQYRSWRGMYGGDQELIPTNSLEERDYRAFLNLAKTDILYRNLIFKCGRTYNGGLVPGYVDIRWPANELPNCRPAETLSRGDARLARRLDQPGEALGDLLNRQNAVRLFARFQKTPSAFALQATLAANVLGCVGERVYNYNQDADAFTHMRLALLAPALKVQTRISALAGFGSETTQEKILKLLGIGSVEWRMDVRTNGQNLGNDCELFQNYSPNPYCQRGSYGYPAYSDGTTMASDLLGYLALKTVAAQDSEIGRLLRSGLLAVIDHFIKSPGGTGYSDASYIVGYSRAVLEDLDRAASRPETLPQYMNDYPFSQLPRWGNGEALCRTLLSKISI